MERIPKCIAEIKTNEYYYHIYFKNKKFAQSVPPHSRYSHKGGRFEYFFSWTAFKKRVSINTTCRYSIKKLDVYSVHSVQS